ncbi:hypothetical protein OIE43_07285 [Streptomyces pseudovenezuelae]|uniref:hypothetical protein n=1 Tax=Streptomyces pseudovenezuelae TaxID=67350 RepID=UPI002E33837E|nr:hypothetical protein [Streptomyces pseudovenezuelae]
MSGTSSAESRPGTRALPAPGGLAWLLPPVPAAVSGTGPVYDSVPARNHSAAPAVTYPLVRLRRERDWPGLRQRALAESPGGADPAVPVHPPPP